MNLSINKFFTLLASIFFLIIVSFLYLNHLLSAYNKELIDISKNKYETRTTVNMLRQSSDDLTKFARQYVVTGEIEFKNNYNAILYIRRGEIKIPQNYQNIYWDLQEPLRSKLHPKTKKISFENMLKSLPYDKFELKKLKEAKDDSDDLVNLEVEAFNTMVGLYKDENGNFSRYDKPNQQKAIALLHSSSYLKAKEKVMLPIDYFLEHLDSRMMKQIDKLENNIEYINNILIILSIVFVLAFILVFIIFRKKVLIPIEYLSSAMSAYRVHKEINKEIFYNDEIGYIINQFLIMKNEIDEDIKVIKTNKRDMEEYLKLVDQNIITSSTDLKGDITYVSEAFARISGYQKEELIGNNHRIVRHSDMPKELYLDLWDTISKNRKWHGEIKNRAKDGEYYWVESTIYPNYDIDGKKTGYTAIRVDITSKKQVETLLEESKLKESKINEYLDLIDKNIITSSTDLSGKITNVSEAFEHISGFTKSELIGKKHSLVKHPDNDESIYDNLWETITNNRVWNGVIKNRKKDGSFYWVDATIYPIFNPYGEKTGYIAIRIDITDKKKVEELLIIDALTQIYNRRHFNEMMPKSINLAKRDRKYFSFLIMDIDHFKQYNDTYGHQEGDSVLQQVSLCIKNSLGRASDMCFRLGGEEFGVLFESLEPHEALKFSNDIRKNIENLHIEHTGNSASKFVTISMGLITKKTTGYIDPDAIYKEADDLLYKAKESGRNRVEANK